MKDENGKTVRGSDKFSPSWNYKLGYDDGWNDGRGNGSVIAASTPDPRMPNKADRIRETARAVLPGLITMVAPDKEELLRYTDDIWTCKISVPANLAVAYGRAVESEIGIHCQPTASPRAFIKIWADVLRRSIANGNTEDIDHCIGAVKDLYATEAEAATAPTAPTDPLAELRKNAKLGTIGGPYSEPISSGKYGACHYDPETGELVHEPFEMPTPPPSGFMQDVAEGKAEPVAEQKPVFVTDLNGWRALVQSAILDYANEWAKIAGKPAIKDADGHQVLPESYVEIHSLLKQILEEVKELPSAESNTRALDATRDLLDKCRSNLAAARESLLSRVTRVAPGSAEGGAE